MQLDFTVSSFVASGNFILLLSVLRLLLTKCCRLGGLNNRNVFLTVDRKLKIRDEGLERHGADLAVRLL